MSGKRGFAGMSQADRSRIASKGGKAAHRKGTAHEFTSAEGRIAGKKGGKARANRDSVLMDDDDDGSLY